MSAKRKIIRNMLKNDIRERKGDHNTFNRVWELYQCKKYGAKQRVKFEARGTKQKRHWRERIEALEDVKLKWKK